jgi:uncharacterized protein
MLTPLPERSQNSGDHLLIAAISGRSLAAAARRAGYRPLVMDMFCDIDTIALANHAARLPGDLNEGVDSERVVEALLALAGQRDPIAVVFGSGFERIPHVVDEVARHLTVAGNSGTSIRRIKDPAFLADACAEIGIPQPEFRWLPPPDPENWMVKRVGAAGGSHVRRAGEAGQLEGHYFQRFMPGESVSALFIGDGQKARIVGFSRQWTHPVAGAPYRYGGAVRLRRFKRRDADMIEGWLSDLVRRAGLVGLCSADFIRARGRYALLEVNPRPGATLDIFDHDDAPLMEAHIRAARGESSRLPCHADCMASMIVYATKPVQSFPAIAWPDWVADRQPPGTLLATGDPVCTAFANGSNAIVTWKALKQRARLLESHWGEI